jgi:hypothetical protein
LVKPVFNFDNKNANKYEFNSNYEANVNCWHGNSFIQQLFCNCQQFSQFSLFFAHYVFYLKDTLKNSFKLVAFLDIR